MKHFNQPGIIGEIVFLADMADGSSSKDVIVPIGRGLVSDKIFEVLVNSDPEDEVKLDFGKLNQAQCHFAIHPNRYRIVHSPNNALTISQEDIDKLISSQDDISCSDITRDREDANCDVYKNGDKQCELGVGSYIEEDPERVVEVEMAEVEIESVENSESIENVQNTENTEIFENVENVEDNENTEISENISENDEIIAPEIKIIAPEVENSENTVEATVESLYENEDEYDVGYESDYTDSDPSENPPTSQDPTVTEEQVIATEETKVEVPVVSESVPEPVTETVSESVTDKKVEVTIAPVSVTEQTEINSDIPETNEPVVAVETDAVAEIDVKKPKSEETSVKSAKSSNNSIWIALGVLAGICLIVVAIVFFQKKSYTSGQPAQE